MWSGRVWPTGRNASLLQHWYLLYTCIYIYILIYRYGNNDIEAASWTKNIIIERLNIWPILATPSVPQPATCRGRQVEGWILAEMWPSSVQYIHAILRMCAFAFAASMIRSNGPPWSDLQALKLLCGSNEHWPTLFSSLVDLIWTLRIKNGQDQLYYFTLCYWKLHAAQVQFLNRRICMPSLGTCSMSSASLSQRVGLSHFTLNNLANCHATKWEDCLAPEVALQGLCFLLLMFKWLRGLTRLGLLFQTI